MPLLGAGSTFPALPLTPPGGLALTLPDALAGEFGVVLFFRGAWCPYCNAQLRAFQRAADRLAEAGIRVVALLVDGEPATADLIARHGLTFPVGHSADARAIAALTGAFVNPDPVHLQSTGLVLNPAGQVVVSVYSSDAIGRLVPEDVIGLVRYLRQRRRRDRDGVRAWPGSDYTPGTTMGKLAGRNAMTVDGATTPRTWTWAEFRALPSERVTADVHCVTRWSKLGTVWEGVSVDTLVGQAGRGGMFVVVQCEGGYATNLPVQDVLGGRAWVAFGYGGRPLAPEHGGPARLLVPHLYFWKSAKWVRRLLLVDRDMPGFWETYGYHDYGDPWREQRYSGD